MGRFNNLEKKTEITEPVKPTREKQDAAPKERTHGVSESFYGEFIAKADEAFYSGDFREGLRHYSRALQEESNHVYPWIGQVMALIEMKQYREAELWSNKALEHFPEDSSLLAARARVLAATANYQRAIGVSDYALQKGATKWTWFGRGDVLLQAGRDNALFCFEKAMEEAGPDDWRIPLLCGLAFARKRQWANAEPFLQEATLRNPRNFFAWYQLAIILVELSHTERARAAIERVRSLNSGYRKVDELEQRLYHQPLMKRVLGFLKRR